MARQSFSRFIKPVATLTLGISLVLFAVSTIAQSNSSNRNIEQPNLQFNVDRRSGKCPSKIGLWSVLLPLEGGADHIAVADTLRFAGIARVVRSTSQFVEYEAPLKLEFASCVGQASSPEFRAYRFEFQRRKLYFQVNPAFSDAQIKIVSKQVVSGRPYVLWQARE